MAPIKFSKALHRNAKKITFIIKFPSSQITICGGEKDRLYIFSYSLTKAAYKALTAFSKSSVSTPTVILISLEP